MIKTLKGLQDVLGLHQDREVQIEMLRELGHELVSRARRCRALMAIGTLIDRLEADAEAARGHFAGVLRRVRVRGTMQARRGSIQMSSARPEPMSKAKRDTRVIATYNIKGGVGKTSAAVNLAYLAAQAGHPTLLWDLDPQAASTYLFRVRPKVKGGGRGLLRGAATPATTSRRPTTTTSSCCRPTSPTGTWTWPSTSSRSRQRGCARCSRRCATTTTTSSSTARRASRSSPRRCSRPPTRCSCP